MRYLSTALIGLLSLNLHSVRADSRGESVVVIYNRSMPESKNVADYYARKRSIPSNQLLGLDLPKVEVITRQDYINQLQNPVLDFLETNKFLEFNTKIITATEERAGGVIAKPLQSKIRYAVLCYGVPARILRDTNIVENGQSKEPPALQRNEAAVDTELALIPWVKVKYPLISAIPNVAYSSTNANQIHTGSGILMVTRLDGPTPEIARSLVDKAIQAETDGLWGRAYFDLRGLTNTTYKLGDDWLRNASIITRRLGIETTIDEEGPVLTASVPLSHIAIYAGWYIDHVCGPFSQPQVEFMPGAFAYHLHSFSAHEIRNPNRYWVGPLLSKGATITMGAVDEPYLEMTPDIGTFISRFLAGFTFGEAAYSSIKFLSWQITIIGDPLYCPFVKKTQEYHEILSKKQSSLIEWPLLKIVDLNEVNDCPRAEIIKFLESTPETRKSAILQEKLGDVYAADKTFDKAFAAYLQALKLKPSPQQKIRLMLTLSKRYETQNQGGKAFSLLKDFVKEIPDYPGQKKIYSKLAVLAKTYGKKSEVTRFEQEAEKIKE